MKWDNHSRDGELGKERKGQRDINRGKVTELMIRERERQTDRERDRERERQTDRQTGRQTERQRETSNAKVESFGTKSVFSRTYLLTDILSHASRKHSTKQGDQTHSVPKQSL